MSKKDVKDGLMTALQIAGEIIAVLIIVIPFFNKKDK